LLIVEVLFLAIYYIAVISTLLAEFLGGEFSNLSSRGSTFNKLIIIQISESLIIGGIALLIGIILALVMVWGIAEFGPISDVKNIGWKIKFTNTALIAASLGMVVCVICLLFPVRKALKRSIVVHTRVSGREERSPFWQRYYLDVILLLIGLILLWRFYFYGGLSEADRFGSVDWLLLLSPFVLLVGAATILYRIFPPVMRGLSNVFASGKGFVATLALFHLARNPANVSRIMLLLILTMSLGILTSGLNATLDASEYERVPAFELLAIDPFSFVKVTKYRVDYASKPMGQVMSSLVFDVRDYEFPTIKLPGTPVALGVWVYDDTLSYDVNNLLESMTIRGKILTASGEVFITNLQFQLPVGDKNESVTSVNDQIDKQWYYFEGDIPPLNEDKYPLSLHSIWFNNRSTDFQYWQISLLMDDILLKYPNNDEIIIDDFENIERIWQANDLQANVNFTRQRSSHSGDGSLNLKLPFDRTIIRGVGLFPGGRLTKYPIPVLASEEFLNSSEMKIGDIFFGAVNSLQIQMVIAGSVRYFPTLYDQPGKGFLVVPLDPLLIYLNQETISPTNSNELWINSSEKNLISLMERKIPNSIRVQTLDEERKSIKADPLSLGLRSVTMISYLIALILSVLGFSSYTFLSSRSREVQFGVLRSLGMSINQLYGMLFIEQTFLIFSGLTIGLILGLAINMIVLPGLPISLSEQPPIPPFLPHMNWGSIFTLYAAMATVFILVLGISTLILWRARIHAVLRIGME
jgi:ABC-type antimicrobial peptide transport system permease subunit